MSVAAVSGPSQAPFFSAPAEEKRYLPQDLRRRDMETDTIAGPEYFPNGPADIIFLQLVDRYNEGEYSHKALTFNFLRNVKDLTTESFIHFSAIGAIGRINVVDNKIKTIVCGSHMITVLKHYNVQEFMLFKSATPLRLNHTTSFPSAPTDEKYEAYCRSVLASAKKTGLIS